MGVTPLVPGRIEPPEPVPSAAPVREARIDAGAITDNVRVLRAAAGTD